MKKVITSILLLAVVGLLAAPPAAKGIPACITNVQVSVTAGCTVYVSNTYGTGVVPWTDDQGQAGYQGLRLYTTGANACSNSVQDVIITVYKPCGTYGFINVWWQCDPSAYNCGTGGHHLIGLGREETTKQFKIVKDPTMYSNCALETCDLFRAQPCVPPPEPREP